MAKAKDIMVKHVMTVTGDMPIRLAMELLVIKKISGLPVVDTDNNLVGIISEKDMLCIVVHEAINSDKTVGDYMTQNVLSFSPDTDLEEIRTFLVDSPIRRVPIAENGKLVGLISRRDVIAHTLDSQ